MKTYIILKDGAESNFLLGKSILKKNTVFMSGKEVTLEKYDLFYSINVQGVIRLFYIPNDSSIENNKNLLEVTGNRKYNVNNILQGSLKNTNIVIEGSDGVGKTTLVKELAKNGLLTQDRAVEEVTRSMKTYRSRKERIQRVETYLRNNPSKKLVFLYLSNEDVLYNRVFSREVVDEFDKESIISQRLYIDTYNALRNYPNLFLVDCLDKAPEEIANKVIQLTNLDRQATRKEEDER